MTKDEALKLALEKFEFMNHVDSIFEGEFNFQINAIKEALAQPEPWEKFCDSNCVWTDHHPDCKLAQPEQEINKDGSPCPEFWDWLPKAYNFEGNGNFTKYNMEVAFLAGKQASQPEQEPVAWRIRCTDPMRDWVLMYRRPKTEEQFSNMEIQPLYTTPPQRTWVGLTDEEIKSIWLNEKDYGDDWLDVQSIAKAIEAKLKEKNT